MTSPKFVKQHGMQRTGTNYVRALIEDNWDTKVLVNVLGWKHGVSWWSWEEWIRAHRAKNGKVRAHVGARGTIEHPWTARSWRRRFAAAEYRSSL